ncbi:MAG: ATP-binding protein [Bacteroidales bacterium]
MAGPVNALDARPADGDVPAAAASAGVPPLGSPQANPATPGADDHLEPVRILLVDDREENLLALETLLDSPDRTLVRATSGRGALRELLRQQFAVILLDVNMPGLDGLETALLVRQRPASAHTPIIFVTAQVDETHMLRAYGLGAVDYILAPFSPDVLKAKVQVFVDLFRMAERNRLQAEKLRQAESQLRVQAEQKLREVDARMRMMVESVVDYAIFSLDPAGHIGSWNIGARRLFGYEDAEIVGRHRGILFADKNDANTLAMTHVQRAAAEGRSEIETWYVRKDGTTFMGNDVLTPIKAPSGEIIGFTKVIRDITERRRAQTALAQKADELAEANRLKDDFLAVLSHELRTPLNAIVGWTHLLLTQALDAEATRRALETIARNGRAQQSLVDDILDVSRFITGKFRLTVAPVDIRHIVQLAVETARITADAKGVTLEADIPDAPLVVQGDADRLQQVTWNLLSNALKFTPKGGRVRVRVGQDERGALVAVEDNGAGIEPAFLPHVFDRFRQADSSNTREHGGLGLGLAIVKHLVELHGGTVKAESAGNNRGATFVISLPALKA